MISISKITGRIIYSQVKDQGITLSRIGLFFSLLGAFLVSSTLAPFYGFIAFSIGAICWVHFALSVKNYELVFLELVFLSTNILGVIMYYD